MAREVTSFLSNNQPFITLQCVGADPSMYASMTAVTRFPRSSQKRPGSANAIRQHANGLLGTPLRPCVRLRVLVYVVVEKIIWPG